MLSFSSLSLCVTHKTVMNVVKSNLLDKQGKSNKNVFIKKIGVKQNFLGNSPDEYNQTKYGRGTCTFFRVL